MKMAWAPIALAAASLAAGLLGCTATPLERALEDLDRTPEDTAPIPDPLPRAVAFRVQLDEGIGALYGTKGEWQADILRAVEALDACERIVPEPLESEADLVVTIHLSRSPAAEPDIQPTGAFLDFLAWSTIPFLPLWIPDVDIQPELHVQLTRTLRSPSGERTAFPSERLRTESLRADPVSTSYLERRPFLSWPTLGAIFVPPFVFSGTEPQHVEAEISAWVREATAVQVAGIVRASSLEEDELLDGLAVWQEGDSGPALAFTPRPGLLRVVARVDGATVGQRDLERVEDNAARRPPATLPLKLRGSGAGPGHVSVLAIGERPGEALTYTVRWPRPPAGAAGSTRGRP